MKSRLWPAGSQGPVFALGLPDALGRLKIKGIEPASLIDIGAGTGREVEAFTSLWPGIKSLLIDMDAAFEPGWRALATRNANVRHIVTAAGSKDGSAFSRKTDATGGVMSTVPVADGHKTVVRSIDSLVQEYHLPPPYFLKFDTHGAELEVLAGAFDTLNQTAVIMMEVYNFKLAFAGGANLTFDEMSLHLKSLGFRCVDLCEPLFRPDDQALWQLHMFFIRSDHPIWRHAGFRKHSHAG